MTDTGLVGVTWVEWAEDVGLADSGWAAGVARRREGGRPEVVLAWGGFVL
jgi:hypothetical protein